jgi:hypothetical protein
VAQDRGTITGAAVPSATITLQSPATGFAQSALSGNDGGYSFLYLASGRHTVTAEKPGFRRAEAADIQVQFSLRLSF